MKFCSQCGRSVSQRIPEGDNRLRYVCDDCGTIHYSNPNNVCGAILTWEERILLCRRAIEPRYGLWTLPAGFMENGETIADAAVRESVEEANASVRELELFGVFSLPHISQVYLMFVGELEHARVTPGAESLETQLFSPDQIPWNELAFPVINYSLRLFLERPDVGAARHQVHTATAIRTPDRGIEWVE